MGREHREMGIEKVADADTANEAPDGPDEPCGSCDGSGKCVACEGLGIVTRQDENERLLDATCPSCEGDGTCWACGGTGVNRLD